MNQPIYVHFQYANESFSFRDCNLKQQQGTMDTTGLLEKLRIYITCRQTGAYDEELHQEIEQLLNIPDTRIFRAVLHAVSWFPDENITVYQVLWEKNPTLFVGSLNQAIYGGSPYLVCVISSNKEYISYSLFDGTLLHG